MLVRPTTDLSQRPASVNVRLLERLGDGGPDVALYVFREGTEEALNDRLLAYLGELVPQNPNGIAPLLQPSIPGHKAKSALFVLSKKAPKDADLSDLLDLPQQSLLGISMAPPSDAYMAAKRQAMEAWAETLAASEPSP